LQAVLSNEREDAMDRLHIPAAGYEEDFVEWLQHQIGLMRERRFAEIDLDNLLEELDGTVSRERRELRSRIEVIIMHLLKCQYQPQRKSDSWLSSLRTQRRELELLLEDSPSLKRYLEQFATDGYDRARRHAAEETRLDRHTFPPSLPYTAQQLLDPDFVP